MMVKLTKGLTWKEANLGCKQLGARLPEIRTAAENADILKLQVKGLYTLDIFEHNIAIKRQKDEKTF